MNNPERDMVSAWAKIFNRIPAMQHHERIENAVSNGTPDYAYCVSGVNGWIEFKCMSAPKKETTKLKVDHWKPLQRDWMKKHMYSPNVFLFLRVGDWDFVFDTHSMFTFEDLEYRELLFSHKCKFKVDEVNKLLLNADILNLIKYKLKGQK